jgi:large subunit ribosomal protein L23
MSSTKSSHFEILRKPLITEKTATFGSTRDGVVFEVHPRANKIEIRDAVEKIFAVKVAKIRVVNQLGKVKRVKAISGQQKARKKAYITLVKGSNSIEVVEGL